MNDRDSKHDDADQRPTAEGSNAGEADGSALVDGPAGDGAGLDPGDETELWRGRTNIKHFTVRLALWLVGNIAATVFILWVVSKMEGAGTGTGVVAAAGVFVVSGCVVVGGIALTVFGTRYRITSQRLFIERGLLSQTIDQTELVRVDDVRIHKTLIDRCFGLGSVSVVSTDATDRETVIEGVADADSVAELIRTRMRVMRRKSLFVERL